MPYKEKRCLKRYWTIGELAKSMNIATSVIRYWEQEFCKLYYKKNRIGHRLFDIKGVEKLAEIYILLRIEKYTIQGAKQKLSWREELT